MSSRSPSRPSTPIANKSPTGKPTAAIADSFGEEDHDQTNPDVAFSAIRRIARSVEKPVTADIEAGYGLVPDELVARLLASGVAGCNLGDTDHAARRHRGREEQCARLERLRHAADAAEFPLVINARVDSWLHARGQPELAVADAIRRGRAYLGAGADCAFPIGCSDPSAIARIVEEIPGPVNVLYSPGDAPRRLRDLGVARISTGPYLWWRVLAQFDRDLSAMAGDAEDVNPNRPAVVEGAG